MRCFTVTPKEGVRFGIFVGGREVGHSLFIGEGEANGGPEVPLHPKTPPEVVPSGEEFLVMNADAIRRIVTIFPSGERVEGFVLSAPQGEDERVLVRVQLYHPREAGEPGRTKSVTSDLAGDHLEILSPGAVLRGESVKGVVFYVAFFDNDVLLLTEKQYAEALTEGFIEEEAL